MRIPKGVTTAISVLVCILPAMAGHVAHADIPLLVNHQGVVTVGNRPFNGDGLFKFGFFDGAGVWLWTNDGSHVGESATTPPEAGVTLHVDKGLYSIRLGDTATPNMVALPDTVFDLDAVTLRVFFDDGEHGEQLLSPDEVVASSPYAFHALRADSAADADTVDGVHAADLDESPELNAHMTDPTAHPNLQLDGGQITSGRVDNARLNMGDGAGIDADMVDGIHAAHIDYDFVSGNDAATDVSGAELEELTNGSVTTLHSHPPGPCGFPAGGIVMWSGSIASIPAGWALCDGTNGTPDLRDRFIVGASQDDLGVAKTNVKGSLMQSGGEHEHTLTIAEMPSHSHSDHSHRKGPRIKEAVDLWLEEPTSSATGTAGGDQAHENCPPFYALAFIMKLAP